MPMPGGIGSTDTVELKKASLPEMLTILDKTLNSVNFEKSVSIAAAGSTEA